MKVILISGGKIKNPKNIIKYIDADSYLIAADRGFDICQLINIKPNLCVGDMDSVKSSLDGQKTKIYKREKDQTDTEIAITIAIKKKADEIVMFGCTGTRLDHTIANITLLKKLAENNIKGKIIDSNNIVMLCDGQLKLAAVKGYFCSLIPLDICCGITTKGLKYSLTDETLMPQYSRGVSNEFVENFAQISVKTGTLLVILSRD